MTPPNTGKGSGKLDHSHTAGGNVKWHICSGEEFGSFLIQLNWQLAYDPVIAERNENLRLSKNLYMNVRSRFIYNSEELEQHRYPSSGDG